MTTKSDTIARIKSALAQGKQIYNTGRKLHGNDVYETLNPESRKLFNLKPLSEVLGGKQ
tara:strand:- start:174 stop:350 length:177 start_codon:yes stop_codon:yes gene_type:complete